MEQKNLFIAAALSVAVLLVWGLLFSPKGRAPIADPVEETVELSEPSSSSVIPPVDDPSGAARPGDAAAVTQGTVSPAVVREPVSGDRERTVEVEAGALVARFTNRGAQLVSLRLLDTEGRNGEPLEMVRARTEGPYPFALTDRAGELSALNAALFLAEPTAQGVRFRYRGPEGEAEKNFALHEDGTFDVDMRVENVPDWGLLLGPGLRNPTAKELDGTFAIRSASYATVDDIETHDAAKAGAPIAVSGSGVRWIGLEDNYFLSVLAPMTPFRQATFRPVLPEAASDGTRYVSFPEGELTDAQEELAPEYVVEVQPGRASFSSTAFFGAKRYRQLESLPGNLGLEETIRWNWFGFLALPMMYALLWIHDNIVANYGWSIVLLTFVIKLMLAPLTHKSYVSSRKMQAIQPKMQAIKQRYRSKLKDKRGRPNMEMQRKQNEELQALMKSEGVNPLGGCLPMLMQMPFFFAFFTLLQRSVELWNAPWAFWIHDLSQPDPYYILPVVMCASQFLSQRMIGTTSLEPAQRMMMNLMPVMFMFFFLGMPSGLVLYWVTSNLLTIVQQFLLQRLRSAGVLAGD